MDIERTLSCLLVLGVFGFIFVAIVRNRNANDRIPYHGINNRIVGYDAKTGAYLVQAPNRRAIEGVSAHVDGNLPANVWSYGDGMFVVDPKHAFDSPGGRNSVKNTSIKWQPVDGRHEILPRGATKTAGHISDQVNGWNHNYIHEIGTPYPEDTLDAHGEPFDKTGWISVEEAAQRMKKAREARRLR